MRAWLWIAKGKEKDWVAGISRRYISGEYPWVAKVSLWMIDSVSWFSLPISSELSSQLSPGYWPKSLLQVCRGKTLVPPEQVVKPPTCPDAGIVRNFFQDISYSHLSNVSYWKPGRSVSITGPNCAWLDLQGRSPLQFSCGILGPTQCSHAKPWNTNSIVFTKTHDT